MGAVFFLILLSNHAFFSGHGNKPSCAMVTDSVAIAFVDALKVGPSHFIGKAFLKFHVLTAVLSELWNKWIDTFLRVISPLIVSQYHAYKSSEGMIPFFIMMLPYLVPLGRIWT